MPPTKRHILCVDDNEDTCSMLTTLLTRQDYDAKPASSIAEALELAHSESFSLYILDSRLPAGTAVTLCHKLREFDPQTPIIVYTGDVVESNRQEVLEAGADAFVTKPEMGELLEAIGRFLS